MALITLNNRSINRSDTASSGQVWTATSATASDFQAGGGENTPAFSARKSGDQTSISAATYTKVTGWSEIFDSGSVWDNGNSKFLPGVVGKYLISATAYMSHVGNAHSRLAVYLNGSSIEEVQYTPGADSQTPQNIVCVANVTNTSDYIELYVHQPSGSTATVYSAGIRNQFSGFKIIGA